VVKDFEIFLPLADLIDVNVERNRLEKERQRLERLLENLNRRLQSPDFISKAKPEIVAGERQKQIEMETNLQKIAASLAQLAG